MLMVAKRCETAVKTLVIFVWADIFVDDVITAETDSTWDSLDFFFTKNPPIETYFNQTLKSSNLCTCEHSDDSKPQKQRG